MNDLGNLVAIGVMVAFTLSVTLFPALLAIVPLQARDQSSSDNTFASFANFIISRYKKIAIVATLIIITISSQLFTNVINDVAIEYFSPKTEFRQATDYMSEHLSGLSQLDFAVDSGEENGINEPAFLQTIAKFEQWLLAQPETDHVSIITNTITYIFSIISIGNYNWSTINIFFHSISIQWNPWNYYLSLLTSITNNTISTFIF